MRLQMETLHKQNSSHTLSCSSDNREMDLVQLLDLAIRLGSNTTQKYLITNTNTVQKQQIQIQIQIQIAASYFKYNYKY